MKCNALFILIYFIITNPKVSSFDNESTAMIWSDYPAFSLRQPPQGLKTDVFITDRKLGKSKAKKNNVVISKSDPVFDILVTPEYLPDPFPVPYPFPIEQFKIESDQSIINNSHSNEKLISDTDNVPVRSSYDVSSTTRKPKYSVLEYIEKADVQWGCPKEFIMEGNICSKIESILAQIGCPEGWNLDNGECSAVETKPVEMICNDGFIENSDRICVKELIAPKQMICPDDFEQTISGCKKKVYSDPVIDCNGAKLVNDRCEKTVIMKPEKICPNLFDQSSDSNFCFHQSSIESKIECADQQLLDPHTNMCIHTTISEPLKKCPSNFQLNNGSCVREIYEEAMRACIEGKLTNDNVCNIITSFGSPKLICPPNFTITDNNLCTEIFTSKKHKHNCLHEQKNSNEICPKAMIKEPIRICPKHSSLTGDECIGNMITQTVLECNSDKVLVGNRCVSKEITDFQIVCDPPFQMTLDKKCINKILSHPKLTCSFGYNYHDDGTCRKIEKVKAILKCPINSELKLNDQEKHECRMLKYFDPEFKCPIRDLNLQMTDKGMKCAAWKVVEPKYTCPPNYIEIESKCSKIINSDHFKICDEGYDLIFDLCVKKIKGPMLVLCPESYDLQKNKKTCVKKITTDRIPVCPQNMDFDKLVGSCFVLKKQYEFNEKTLSSTNAPKEALKDLSMEKPTTPAPKTVMDMSESHRLPPFNRFGSLRELPPMKLPTPQLTIVQQPVVVPQPAVILPQQAPVPPAPVIRVPYAMPQPIPTPVNSHAKIVEIKETTHHKKHKHI